MDDRFESWRRIVDTIVRGDHHPRPTVRLGPTPEVLKQHGLTKADLVMPTGKIAKARRDHPEISLKIWHDLPQLLAKPSAIFPSAMRDGSIIALLVVTDVNGSPIIVPVVPGAEGRPNTVLSLYGKDAGMPWVLSEISRARQEGLHIYLERDFAASLPQPGSAEAIPSSPDPIPVDGTAKSKRHILTLRKDSTNS